MSFVVIASSRFRRNVPLERKKMMVHNEVVALMVRTMSPCAAFYPNMVAELATNLT